MVAWENEALLTAKESDHGGFEIIAPSLSILAEPPVTWVDKVVNRRGTRAVAQAYLEFLYSPEGQEIAAKHLLPAAPGIGQGEIRQHLPEGGPVHD